jgi:hypothetical protein
MCLRKDTKKYTASVPVYETQEDKILKALFIVVINWQPLLNGVKFLTGKEVIISTQHGQSLSIY